MRHTEKRQYKNKSQRRDTRNDQASNDYEANRPVCPKYRAYRHSWCSRQLQQKGEREKKRKRGSVLQMQDSSSNATSKNQISTRGGLAACSFHVACNTSLLKVLALAVCIYLCIYSKHSSVHMPPAAYAFFACYCCTMQMTLPACWSTHRNAGKPDDLNDPIFILNVLFGG